MNELLDPFSPQVYQNREAVYISNRLYIFFCQNSGLIFNIFKNNFCCITLTRNKVGLMQMGNGAKERLVF